MKNKLPLILILGGLAIGAITLFGYQSANKKSDDQYLQEAILNTQADARNEAEELADLKKTVLEVSPICEQVKTQVFSSVCEYEPDEGQTPTPWATGLSETEQLCLLETFHFTNFHAFELAGKEYDPEMPSDLRVIDFACDISAASLYSESTDGMAFGLITAFHKERAGRNFGAPKAY